MGDDGVREWTNNSHPEAIPFLSSTVPIPNLPSLLTCTTPSRGACGHLLTIHPTALSPSLFIAPTLHRLFLSRYRYGEVGDVYIPRDHHTGDPRGFAFVRFKNRDDAEEAMKQEDDKVSGGLEKS